MEMLGSVPPAYWVLAFVWAVYQGARGVLEHEVMGTYRTYPPSAPTSAAAARRPRSQRHALKAADEPRKVSAWHRFLLVVLHDFAFRFVCTIAGFVALAAAIHIAGQPGPVGKDWTAVAALLAVAVPGIGGQLHWLILLGKPMK